ncbi:PREDICTED: activin receptor type-2A [Nicrophorus vespilloides]|uniref:Serine/threonine-protein kinase receptor n=1 Tax=Nicrophorus vespilloides TaxID=110193 RepID=A0ABM1MRP0_NICVS|nr:PREDICTED: activin receptor type-2A [Nicrophorus vespilloides]XP_017777240.1 PREDICTED: activin receptor type-2A [Nicrophorus vespilloides]
MVLGGTFVLLLSLVCVQGLVDVSLQKNAKSDGTRICAKHIGVIDAEEGSHDTVDTIGETTCEESSHCYAFWQEDPVNRTIVIFGQGCWVSGNAQDCERQDCLSDKKPSGTWNNTKFCCCTGDMCNLNFTDIYVPVEETSSPATTEALPKSTINPFIIIGCIVAIIMCAMLLILFNIKPKKTDIEMGQPPLPPPPDYSLNKLKLINIIGQGRYGSVWKGIVDDQDVAVKVFPPHHRNYFLNEHDLYKEAGENVALLKCLGGGERCINPGGPANCLLILSLEQECLQEYLKNHTLDLVTLSKMSLGVARGLAHLHSDLGKPCIAHRDINTRNILVKSDLSCCICDLGLAVIPRRTENRSLSEAGTLRYMAPEVLEGAVNLRDCESALKQIDVYSLGLVLWELGARCTDMQVTEPQPYAPPFHKEAGTNPSLEQMQNLVSRHKARPLWPSTWKDTAAARLLCETAEDCWDQDAEARLTSLCVEERLLELPTLKGRALHPMHPPSSPTPLINNNHLHDHNIDASVGTIVTLLSPSEENCKNSNQLQPCIIPLQPYQGRNPCKERNLLTNSSDSLLIDKSSKHCTSSESQNLVTSDYLNFHVAQRALPIPYVQNAVHSVSGPKQLNNPQTNSKRGKFPWTMLRKMFNGKKSTSNIRKDTQVRIVPGKMINGQGVATSLLNEKRPSTLPLIKTNDTTNTKSGVSQLMGRGDSLNRQRSLEQFSEVFSSTSDLSRLKDPSLRIKTPGDVPPSVRRTRGKAAKDSAARFSLYDDRMMSQWGSAPDLEPSVVPLKPQQINDLQDRDSVSSF